MTRKLGIILDVDCKENGSNVRIPVYGAEFDREPSWPAVIAPIVKIATLTADDSNISIIRSRLPSIATVCWVMAWIFWNDSWLAMERTR